MSIADPVLRAAYNRAWRLKNKERIDTYKRKWKAENKDKISAYGKQHYGKVKHLKLARKRSRYFPSRSCPEFCEGGCGRKAKCLDHNHKTGKFRGWLCWNCNVALGLVRDSQSTLLNLASYVEVSCQ